MKIGSLCSGYGGLDRAVEAFYSAPPAWFCEFAAGPSKILAHHYPDVPNHHDLTETDWATVEPVDIVTAGWPCQPWSVAGKQKGVADERAIWPAIAAAIRVLRPRIVVLENVPAIVALGELARAVGDLAAIGYDAQWTCIRASDVGAPHRRERCFVVARHADCMAGSPGRALGGRPGAVGEPGAVERTVGSDRAPSADAACDGRHEGWPESAGVVGGSDVAVSGAGVAPDASVVAGRVRDGNDVRARRGVDGRDQAAGRGAVADADDSEQDESPGAVGASDGWSAAGRPELRARRCDRVDWGTYRPAIERWEHALGRCAPAPTEPGPRDGQRLAPVFVEWMMGLPVGWVTSVPDLSRSEQLKALGNGVVPQQAYAALCDLQALGVAA